MLHIDAEPKDVGKPPVDSALAMAEQRFVERQRAWHSEVVPLAEKVSDNLAAVGGPDNGARQRFFEELLPIIAADPATAHRLAHEYVGRYLAPAALAAGVSPEETQSLLTRGRRR